MCVRKKEKEKEKEKIEREKEKKKPAHKLVPCHSVFFIQRDNLNFSIEKKSSFPRLLFIPSLASSNPETVHR